MNMEQLQEAANRIARRHRTAAPETSPAKEGYWQLWKEQDGHWVACGDPLPPGYQADPPQFEPLPGEEIMTPAFPQ